MFHCHLSNLFPPPGTLNIHVGALLHCEKIHGEREGGKGERERVRERREGRKERKRKRKRKK